MNYRAELISEINKIEWCDHSSNEGYYDEVLKVALRYINSPDPETALEAHRQSGEAHFEKKRFKEALPFFQECLKRSESKYNYYKVAISSVHSGQLPLASEAIKKVLEWDESHSLPPAEGGFSIPYIRYSWAAALCAAHEYKLAFEQVEILRPLYITENSIDPYCLSPEGLPDLSRFLDLAEYSLRWMGKSPERETWIRKFSTQLNGYGQHYIKKRYVFE